MVPVHKIKTFRGPQDFFGRLNSTSDSEGHFGAKKVEGLSKSRDFVQRDCSALIVRIFFINPRQAYRDTEKDGERERDTRITSGKGVTRHVARGYLLT